MYVRYSTSNFRATSSCFTMARYQINTGGKTNLTGWRIREEAFEQPQKQQQQQQQQKIVPDGNNVAILDSEEATTEETELVLPGLDPEFQIKSKIAEGMNSTIYHVRFRDGGAFPNGDSSSRLELRFSLKFYRDTTHPSRILNEMRHLVHIGSMSVYCSSPIQHCIVGMDAG